MPRLSFAAESWPLRTPFRISRGVKTHTDVVLAVLEAGEVCARGEGVPLARYGETCQGALGQLESVRPAVEQGLSRRELLTALPPGAARNALDCALWSLEARLPGGEPRPTLEPRSPLVTALTVSLDQPEAMAAAAKALAGSPLIKVKVDASDPEAQVRAVRAEAPDCRLIVDANESWDFALLLKMQPVLKELRVSLLEQPLPAGGDQRLSELQPEVPICADESCHITADLGRLAGAYQAVNIKLDKTGGLTAAFDLYDGARKAGFQVMVGCMICTSLSIAPALQVARLADFADLDGPMWLAQDRAGGVTLKDGAIIPPPPGLWDVPYLRSSAQP